MGSGLAGYSESLTEEQVKLIAGEKFDQTQFNRMKDVNNLVTKKQLMESIVLKTDAFLTHDWGKEGRDNHAYVVKVGRGENYAHICKCNYASQNVCSIGKERLICVARR